MYTSSFNQILKISKEFKSQKKVMLNNKFIHFHQTNLCLCLLVCQICSLAACILYTRGALHWSIANRQYQNIKHKT